VDKATQKLTFYFASCKESMLSAWSETSGSPIAMVTKKKERVGSGSLKLLSRIIDMWNLIFYISIRKFSNFIVVPNPPNPPLK